jgi:cell division protein FtsW
MTKDIDGNNLSGKSGIRVERTLDGTPITDSEGKTIAELEEERAKLRGIEERSRIRLHSDRYLWGIYLMLLVFSVVELYSASSSEVKAANVYHPLMSHAMFLVVGLGVVMIMQNIHYKYYRKFAWIFAFLSLILVWYGNHHGVMANGAMRAIRVMGFTIQPPEIAKLALVVVLARIMAKHQMRHGVTRQGVLLSLCMLAAFGLMLYSNGLTNTALIVIIATAMFVIGGTQLNKLAVIFCIFAVVGGIVYNTKFKISDANAEGTATEMAANSTVGEAGGTVDRTELRQKRVTDFLEGVEPDDTVTDFNRQVFFANMSQAHGGLLGNGPGNSRESARLPLAFSDYIFSIVVEDTGFVGGVCLLILYLLLLARAGVIASKCTKAFPALLITGCATLIVSQAMIHMAIVVGLAPVSGQPLPFISKGGTSILVMSAAMGMMLSVSKFAIQRTRKTQDANLTLKQAVEDSGDTSVNPTMLHAEVKEEHTRSAEQGPTSSKTKKSIK